MSLRYLTMPEILWLHQESLKRYGGRAGIRDSNLLESAVVRPQMSFSGSDIFATLTKKAAAYLDSFARNHPFIDGNKRIAYISAGRFLQLNTKYLLADADEAESFVLAIVTTEIEIVDIASWLDEHCVFSEEWLADENSAFYLRR